MGRVGRSGFRVGSVLAACVTRVCLAITSSVSRLWGDDREGNFVRERFKRHVPIAIGSVSGGRPAGPTAAQRQHSVVPDARRAAQDF